MVTGGVKAVLQLEGAALFVAALCAYWFTGGNWWLFLVLFFVPDVSFAAYLVTPKIGALAYNILHSTIGAFVLAAIGWWLGNVLVQHIAIIWFGHVGFDRAVGYGLKYASDFKDTHLGRIGRA